MSDSTAELSVVLVAHRGFDQIRRTLYAIAAQSIAARIEVVVVVPDPAIVAGEEGAFRHFASHRLCPVGAIDNVDHAAAAGLLAARAAHVASIEDHAYPEPEWAEELLAAWREEPDRVAFGSAILNANPGSMLSWSNSLIAYGQWSERTPPGEAAWIAMHNGAFRRDALKPIGADLPGLFNRESEVLTRLQAAGGRFGFAPRARIRHLNPSRLGSTAQLRSDAGRLFAAQRASSGGWGFGRRLAYAALSPAVPALRYLRMRKELFGAEGLAEVRLGVPLLVGLVFDAIGQMLGNLIGPGGARERLATFEMDRMEHLNARDRAAFRPERGSSPARRLPCGAPPERGPAAPA